MIKSGSYAAALGAALIGIGGCNSEDDPAQDGQVQELLLIGATDYTSLTEIVAIDLERQQPLARHVLQDGNAVPQESGGVGYLLERNNDRVHRLDAGGQLLESFELADGDGRSNVNRVLTVSEQKAYVALYERNRIELLALGTASRAGSIDLEALQDPNDTDLSIDLQDAVITPARDRAYFLAARIDTESILADPDFKLRCSETPALLIGVDTASDTLLDLNGDEPGEALPLALKSPSALALAASADVLYVSSAGCYEGDLRTQHGVERVDLAEGTSSVVYAPNDQNYHGRLLVTGPTSAVLETADENFVSHWLAFSLPDWTLDGELEGLPDAVQYEREGVFVGLALNETALDVVRYDTTQNQSQILLEAPWTEDLSSPAGSALVR